MRLEHQMLEERCKVYNIGASRKKDGFTRIKIFSATLELLPLLSFTALEHSQEEAIISS